MDIETLRELIVAFQSLGEEAKEAFVWYLILEYVPAYVIGAIWTVIGGFAVMRIIRLLQSLNCSGRLMEAAGVQIMWGDAELSKACEVLRASRQSK